ncbi:hypothetical protein SDC9_46161 [bioreactor metagenome]|uniref:Uncharacterized protein n=1 Tax=bioreactor metagenome TaxID=1076179 RepID=A0A644W850_9ZZZZ|nr:hypothetical protein [Methanobrevibacter sp.]MEA4957822.1 hypothetical protein [Methanobrevibacter sp.]
MRIKDVKADKNSYNLEIDNKEDFSQAIELLKAHFNNKELYKNENDKFPIIYTVIGL